VRGKATGTQALVTEEGHGRGERIIVWPQSHTNKWFLGFFPRLFRHTGQEALILQHVNQKYL